jgi:hypothetical protein
VKDISETLGELERAGFTVGDRMRLRFHFEAPSLRAAVELANALRMSRHNHAHVRPAPARVLTSRRWSVIVTTPPAPMMRAVIELWAEQLHETAESYEGCRMIDWSPIVVRLRTT